MVFISHSLQRVSKASKRWLALEFLNHQQLHHQAILRGALDEHLKVDYLSASSCITACSLALQWPAALQYLPELERTMLKGYVMQDVCLCAVYVDVVFCFEFLSSWAT